MSEALGVERSYIKSSEDIYVFVVFDVRLCGRQMSGTRIREEIAYIIQNTTSINQNRLPLSRTAHYLARLTELARFFEIA